jgi:hypothetical protein
MRDVGDVEGMGKDGVKILRNPDVLETFKKAALARAEEFRIDLVLPKYLALYDRITE